ncbi:transposase [Nonomuraea sp. NBC_00507]|uniref:IS701 family transposase n=1 Tax=Nonomuraea sp. NBC_00507 TaxID=2976002 RepID=UPI002E192259
MDDLGRYCHDMLSPLPRSDQRRWGEVYIRGLVEIPGRKSLRRIAEQITGRPADQCLQQFVNQSPWDHVAVRHVLARSLVGVVRPRAWVVAEVAFPKNGDKSVGVARQFAATEGRRLNCQLALAALLVGDPGACPVDWRLMLPKSWDQDEERRALTGVPDTIRHRPRVCHVVDLVDELRTAAGLRPAPVIVPAEPDPDVLRLVTALEERALQYVVRVAETTAMSGEVTVGDLASRAALGSGGLTLWRDDGTGESRFTSVLLRTRLPSSDRKLIVEWSPRGWLKSAWLSNLTHIDLYGLTALINLRHSAADGLARMSDETGLRHFEGRSFRGWHHHVTLSSLAWGYRLRRIAESDGFRTAI